MKKIIIPALLALSVLPTWSKQPLQSKQLKGNQQEKAERKSMLNLSNYSYYVRMNYNLGGTAPIGMPATIRTLHSYSLRPNFTLGFDAFHPFNQKWGIMFGLHFENKGMKTDAGVKNYHMSITRGTTTVDGVEVPNVLDGNFTGSVVTKVDQSLATIPVQATYDISQKVRIKLGPYFSYVTSKKFEGYAYDGYLRQGEPTGPKVELGHDQGQRGEYDFSDDMRNWQFGIDVGADWYITKRWGANVGLTWGLSEVFKKDFKTIEQSMYPIYGNIGIIYQLK